MRIKAVSSDEAFVKRMAAFFESPERCFEWLEPFKEFPSFQSSDKATTFLVSCDQLDSMKAAVHDGLHLVCVVAKSPTIEDAQRCFDLDGNICLTSEEHLEQTMQDLEQWNENGRVAPFVFLEFVVSGDGARLEAVINLLRLILSTRTACTERSQWAALSATDEALANGVKHGHGGDESALLILRLILRGFEVEIAVADQGEGFELGGVLDPLQPENLWRGSGRGILMMNSAMDAVDFDQGGSRVKMRKTLVAAKK